MGAHGRGRGRGRGRVGSGSPGAGSQAAKTANTEAGLEFNPGIEEGRQQARGSRKREKDIGSWYDQLSQDYAQSQEAGQRAFETAQDATSKQLAEAAQRGKGERSELSKQDEEFARTVGGPTDTAGLTKIAQAGAAAERSRVALNAPVAQTEANYLASLGGRRTSAQMRGIEARKEEANRRDKLLSDVGRMRKEKGAARVVAMEKLSEAGRDYATELKKLGLAGREARTAEQTAAAEQALARIKAAHEARQDSISNRQAQERVGISRKNAQTAARSQRTTARHYRHESKGGLSTSERRARGEHKADAMSAAKALLGIKVPKNAKQWAQFEAALIEKLGSSYGAEAARAVAKLRKLQSMPPVPYAPTKKGRKAAQQAGR